MTNELTFSRRRNIVYLTLPAVTVAAELIVGLIRPGLVVVNGGSSLPIIVIVLMILDLVLRRFFPEIIRAIDDAFSVFYGIFGGVRGLAMMAVREHQKEKLGDRYYEMPLAYYTLTVMLICLSSIPVLYFPEAWIKIMISMLLFTAYMTALVVAVLKRNIAEYREKRAREEQERREQEKREEMGYWK